PGGVAPSKIHHLVLHAQGGLVPTPDYVAFLSQAQRSGILQEFAEKEGFWIEIAERGIVHAHRDCTRGVEEQRMTRDDLLRALETQIRRLFHRLFSSMPREFLFWAGPCLLAEQSLRLNANLLRLDSARAADEALRDLGKYRRGA